MRVATQVLAAGCVLSDKAQKSVVECDCFVRTREFHRRSRYLFFIRCVASAPVLIVHIVMDRVAATHAQTKSPHFYIHASLENYRGYLVRFAEMIAISNRPVSDDQPLLFTGSKQRE